MTSLEGKKERKKEFIAFYHNIRIHVRKALSRTWHCTLFLSKCMAMVCRFVRMSHLRSFVIDTAAGFQSSSLR